MQHSNFRANLLVYLPGFLGLVLLLSLLQPIYAQGTMKWSFDTGGAILSSPALGDEGVGREGQVGTVLLGGSHRQDGDRAAHVASGQVIGGQLGPELRRHPAAASSRPASGRVREAI